MTNRPDTTPVDPATGPRELEETAAPVDVISRWETFGGTWRVTARADLQVTVSLYRCDGGEEQQRLTSSDPALTAWLGDRASSEP